MDATDSVDVLIVGAGVSGIGVAYYLQRDHPGAVTPSLRRVARPAGTYAADVKLLRQSIDNPELRFGRSEALRVPSSDGNAGAAGQARR